MLKNSSFIIRAKTALLIIILMQPAAVLAEKDGTKPVVADDTSEARSSSAFTPLPGWPSRKPREKTDRWANRIPPPPPGPYMSTALSGFAADGAKRGFSSDTRSSYRQSGRSDDNTTHDSGNQRTWAKSGAVSDSPMATFSPDTPWPSNLRPPKRWEPESGYHYVNPQNDRRWQAGTYYPRAPGYRGGRDSFGTPHMNMPHMRMQGMEMRRPAFNATGPRTMPDERATSNAAMEPPYERQYEQQSGAVATNKAEPAGNSAP